MSLGVGSGRGHNGLKVEEVTTSWRIYRMTSYMDWVVEWLNTRLLLQRVRG